MRWYVLFLFLATTCAPSDMPPPVAGGIGEIDFAPPVMFDTEPPQLQVTPTDSEQFEALSVREAQIDTQIIGLVARTRMVMTFFNPHSRVLEGELVFPLPEGATVSGFALDVNGELVEAVVIEKEKARVVFEKEVRKGVDPGIVEHVGGNNFRTRVYPIPANGTRTIAIEYVRQLDLYQEKALYQLPLSFAAGLEKLGVRVDVPNTKQAPQIEWQGMEPIQMRVEGSAQVGELTVGGAPLSGRLVLWLQRAGRAVAVEQTPDGAETHFVIAEPVGRATGGETRSVSRLVILWDASHSRRNANHDQVLAAFAAYFDALGASDVEVEVRFFANDLIASKTIRVGAGNIEPLRQAVKGVAYDGGTQLAAISPGKNDRADAYFLVSDGMSNFGSAEPTGLAAPLYAISVGQRINPIYLRHLAESSGGAYFNLARLEPSALADAVAAAPLAVTDITIKEGKVTELLPPVGRPVQGQLTLAGKLHGERATIEVSLGRGGHTMRTLTYTVEKQRATTGMALARLWAQQKVAQLAAFPKQNQKRLVSLGKMYNLVTPGTSMIVLERLEQYIEHDIRPPASLTEMRAAFDSRAQQKQAATERDRQQKLERMISLWKERVAWWETVFDQPQPEPEDDAADQGGGGSGMGSVTLGGRGSGRRPASAPRPSRSRSRRSSKKSKSAAPSSSRMEMEMADAAPMESKAKEKDDIGGAGAPGPSIELKPWDPDTPYLKALKAVPPAEAYAAYLQQKAEFGASPAFYLDCADFLFRNGEPKLGLRVLSTVAELEIEDAPLMRVVAHKLAQLDRLELARMLFERVLDWRPEEPQSYRDLALVLARQETYDRAMELLARVVMKTWDRFAQIELIALMELNSIIPKARAAGIQQIPIDARLIKLLDVDIRISLSWDADLTDIDMWVMEPDGTKAYYGHNQTSIGGLVSRDFTQGYGPEEYLIHRAMPGTYTVKANYYGSRAQTLTGAVTVQLDLYTNYGRQNEERKSITLRLSKTRETITVGELRF